MKSTALIILSFLSVTLAKNLDDKVNGPNYNSVETFTTENDCRNGKVVLEVNQVMEDVFGGVLEGRVGVEILNGTDQDEIDSQSKIFYRIYFVFFR